MNADPSPWTTLGPAGLAASLLPFATLLLAIALLPLFGRSAAWWHSNRNKFLLSLPCALAGALLYLSRSGDWGGVLHAYGEYLAFLALLSALFVVSGGIHIQGHPAGRPAANTLLLGLGAALANLLGTTGAAMLLLRPLLRANAGRRRKTHIFVFFIFLVANCGGLLTPLGDPPLFLGFLRGVPFFWTLGLAKAWAFVVLSLLLLFYLLDRRHWAAEGGPAEAAPARGRLRLEGGLNLWLLPALPVGVIVSTLTPWPLAFQCLFFFGLALLSWRLTPERIHRDNGFDLHPLAEVAALFFGIFGAMLPALALLQARAGSLPLESPAAYFWATGLLSGFLDNAPTYLTFATLASAKLGGGAEDFGRLAASAPHVLAAISCGSVFMGALTYLGNGPNFMVKSICERSGVRMPSFGAYLLWAGACLLPILLLMQLLLF